MHDVNPGHALFGSAGLIRCDVCGAGRQVEYLRGLCGMTGEMLEWGFDNTRRDKSNEQVYDAAQWVSQNPAQFLTLLGKYGLGKTRFLACIVNEGRARGWKSVYTTTAKLLDHLRSSYATNANVTFDGLWDLYAEARVLAIDEFDRWNPTEWAREKFEQLIDVRFQDRQNKLTCFAANAKIADLPGYVASRMQDRSCYLYEMTGQDVRRLMR